MQYNKIKELHKKIQIEYKAKQSEKDKIIIRHWNVLYNQMRGRDLSVIEKICGKKLYNELLAKISEMINYSDFKKYDHYHASDSSDYKWATYNSLLMKIIEKEFQNEE